MKSLKNKHAFFENEISEMRIVMESTREGLQKEQGKNDIKDSRIEVGFYHSKRWLKRQCGSSRKQCHSNSSSTYFLQKYAWSF